MGRVNRIPLGSGYISLRQLVPQCWVKYTMLLYCVVCNINLLVLKILYLRNRLLASLKES